MQFLLFYSPKPQSQVRILIYQNWPIVYNQEKYSDMQVGYSMLYHEKALQNYFIHVLNAIEK